MKIHKEAMRGIEKSVLKLSEGRRGISYGLTFESDRLIVHDRSPSSLDLAFDADTVVSVEVPLPTLLARKNFLKLVSKDHLKDTCIEFRTGIHSNSWFKSIRFSGNREESIKEAESIATVDVCIGRFRVRLGDMVDKLLGKV